MTIGHNQFQNIPHRVAKFCQYPFREMKKICFWKKDKITGVKYNSLRQLCASRRQ